ncbi:MAG: SynChlorMet cassette protein ScmC [Deltaproteobacteria bacterium]|nr:MAG: SynChlorMet cassette protein ScmC [Deltaproteobacteria bacterium]
MRCLIPRGTQYGLELADGSIWFISAEDAEADVVLSRLGDVMGLRVIPPEGLPPQGTARRLLVSVSTQNPKASPLARPPCPTDSDGITRCVLHRFPHGEEVYIHLVQLSMIFARDVQFRGGGLLHGALAARDGVGVILAAPSGTGKTTASVRFPETWRSWSDDMALVVRDARGKYLVHPWPTWSRFLPGGGGGRWKVQQAVPLGAIFFLSRAVEDSVEPVGGGQAVTLLVHSAQQSSHFMSRVLKDEETRTLHLERFDNLCALAKVVPVHLLHISLTGSFWQEIERILAPA